MSDTLSVTEKYLLSQILVLGEVPTGVVRHVSDFTKKTYCDGLDSLREHGIIEHTLLRDAKNQ